MTGGWPGWSQESPPATLRMPCHLTPVVGSQFARPNIYRGLYRGLRQKYILARQIKRYQ